jgi:iduronate 2-sulfatase
MNSPRSRRCLLLAALFAGLGTLATAARLNVLMLVADDLRPELACYGADFIRSPNLDRLAAAGVRFDRAYCQYAICGPSRASLLTGLRPDTLKIEDIDTFFRHTVPEVVTLPQYFKEHGYRAIYFGKVFHAGQTDDDHSWSANSAGHERREGGEYQLPASRAEVQRRRTAAIAAYGSAGIDGLAGGPAWEAADAPDNAYPDGRTAEAAVAALHELKTAGQPFFLAVGFHKPHLPFVAPKKYFDLYDPATLPLAVLDHAPADAPSLARHSSLELRTRTGVPAAGPIDEAIARELRRAYAACTSFVDAQVGRVLAELDALGLRENTIVIFWGDHGWHLGEFGIWGKATDHEVATRAPLLVSAPGRKARGLGSSALVEFVDVYPTLCELAGLPVPGGLEGTSLVPLLDEPARPWKTAAFSQFPVPALREWAARPLSPAMRKTFFGPLMDEVEARLRREHGARYDQGIFEREIMGYTMRTDRYRFTAWVDRRDPTAEPYALELYDHTVDPQETVNLARQPAQREVVAQLRRQWLAGWRAAKPAGPS